MITGPERRRVTVVFAFLAGVAVLVLGRLGDLQVLRAAEPDRDGPPLRARRLPAARGTILDRHGDLLAFDRPVLEIRVEVERIRGFPTAARQHDRPAVEAVEERLVRELLWALSRDQARFGAPAARDALRESLAKRVGRAIDLAIEEGRSKIDILVDRSIDEGAAILALDSLDFRRCAPEHAQDYRLYVHKTLRFERVYTEPDRAAGVVGTLRPAPLERVRADGSKVQIDDRLAVSGLERLAILEPGPAGTEDKLLDAQRRPLWTGRRRDPAAPVEVHSTLDRALQVRADVEIAAAADQVTAKYGSPPEWGAIMLVDVPTGGVLAAASYTAARDGTRERYGAFAPTQRLFEPGSIVKPLHLAMVFDRGLCSTDESVDCSPGYRAGSDFDPALRSRTITDSHANGPLTLAGILIHSSNIGAVRLGLRLGPQGIEEYLQHYRFGAPSGMYLAGELVGRRPDPIPGLSHRERLVYTGPSVLFGYQVQATTAQVARAYLSFLGRHDRELRLVTGVDIDGEWREPAPPPGSAPFFGEHALDVVKDAMVQVVEHPKGTARAVGDWLRKLRSEGRTGLEIAGKTGTSEFDARQTTLWNGKVVSASVRTSSFVGFTPVREPRYLVVCVLQKAGAGSFYGGTYAAPAASRLLVHALEREGGGPAASADRSGSAGVVVGTEPGGSDYSKRR